MLPVRRCVNNKVTAYIAIDTYLRIFGGGLWVADDSATGVQSVWWLSFGDVTLVPEYPGDYCGYWGSTDGCGRSEFVAVAGSEPETGNPALRGDRCAREPHVDDRCTSITL